MTEKNTQNVLIFEASNEVGKEILPVLTERGVHGITVSDAKQAATQLATQPLRMAFVELGENLSIALDFLSHVRCDSPDMPVIAIGPARSVSHAVRAMQAGASEYLTYPVDRSNLEKLLDNSLPNHEEHLAAEANKDNQYLYRIAGSSEALMKTIDLGKRVACSSMPVLITGESGTGKELISYLVHSQSRRASGPYIRVNCAALSESLLESELFGHERGAFTGAHSQRKGRFELAHQGTLLLDEISETGPRLQAELLRVLEQQDFQRLGGTESINVDVRIICTSNRNLEAEVRKGNFRQDLYYRIRGVQLTVPPLRDRAEDITALIWHFVNLYAHETQRKISKLDDGMLSLFAGYWWPGNIRQLRNIVRTALVLGKGSTLALDNMGHIVRELTERPSESCTVVKTTKEAALTLQDLERQAVLEALKRTNSHQVKAARLLGISDRTLREKIRRYRQDGHLQVEGEEQWSVSRAS